MYEMRKGLKEDLNASLKIDAFNGYPVQRLAVQLAAILVDEPHITAGRLVRVIQIANELSHRLSAPKKI